MFKKLVIIMLVLGLGLTACGSSPVQNGAAVNKIRLPMGYIANIQFAPFYVAVDKGYFKEAGFEIEFDYSVETDGVSLVGAGNLPFAIASGDQVLLARAQGVPVTYIAAWYQQYPVSVIASPSLNIKSPADLRGHKIGLPGLFGATYIGAQAMLFSAGLKDSDVQFESIGFDQVNAFATGKNDIVVGYTANEPIQLRAQGIDVTELRVSDYAQLASNGILTNEETISQKPKLVQAFVRAFLKGLQYTIDHPAEAMTISARYIPDFTKLDAKVQRQILDTSIGEWQADRLGYSDPVAWENMQNVLFNMGQIKQKMDLQKAFTNQFVP